MSKCRVMVYVDNRLLSEEEVGKRVPSSLADARDVIDAVNPQNLKSVSASVHYAFDSKAITWSVGSEHVSIDFNTVDGKRQAKIIFIPCDDLEPTEVDRMEDNK